MRRRVGLGRAQHPHHVAAGDLLEVGLRIAAPGDGTGTPTVENEAVEEPAAAAEPVTD